MIIKTITVIIFINGAICVDLTVKNNKTYKTNCISSTVSCERQEKIKQKGYDLVNVISENIHFYNNLTFLRKIKYTRKAMLNQTNKRLATIGHQNTNHKSLQLPRLRPSFQPSTHSYMEFYYLDNSDDNNRGKKKSIFTNLKTTKAETGSIKRKVAILRPSVFLLRTNYTSYNISSEMLPYSMLFGKDAKFTNDTKTLSTVSLKHRHYKSQSCNSIPKSNEYNYKTLSYVSKKENMMNLLSQEKNNIEKKFPSISTKTFPQKFGYTTAYDRIKFFEMYDSDTYPPPSTPMKHGADTIESNYEYNRKEVNLREIDNDNYNSKNNLSRHSKKYVTHDDVDSNKIKTLNYNILKKKIKNQFATPLMTSTMFSYLSRPASWSDFPFVAVYTYEPAQVYCDCGAISPHWLVSSATCLYLHHRVVGTEGRSAFVSYCGNNWRHPGRVAYVKQSLLHPRFKPLDKTRRQLYNIGLIQVINSMADTCNGWHPVSLMSHQFVAGRDGILATAVGWGLDRMNTFTTDDPQSFLLDKYTGIVARVVTLKPVVAGLFHAHDRYDTRYTSSELPLHSLMLYQGLLYSDSCPGNSGYSEAKLLNEERVKNVYCLKLPVYVMEENDTVHGSLLLVGGKLIALYLQEERRSWGEQSAQYTGIWRLIPWLLEVAQETDEHGSLDTEI